MSRPSISIPNLPPNLFFHITLLTLSLTSTTLAAPLPKGGHFSSHGGSHGGGSGGGSSGGEDRPLRTRDIVGIVLGVVFGTIVTVILAFMLTNLDWCAEKENAWRARRAAKKNGAVAVKSDDGDDDDDTVEEKDSEWDNATNVGDAEAETDDEKKSPVTYSVEEVAATPDSISEFTDMAEQDNIAATEAAPEVAGPERKSWRDKITGRWTSKKTDEEGVVQ